MTLTRGVRLGAYEISELIGVGGMGEVYRARDTKLERDVAIKVLPDAQRLDPDALRRFEREALLLASLNHPNIATLHGLETEGHSQALVMELVEGETLEQRIARSAQGQGLPQNEALEIALQIAGALEAAHERGIVHRDLKPANIKIRPDGTIKVLDFGIAKALAAQALERSHGTVARTPGTLLGTPSYMSPEQASGNPVDRRADIWAFGCVLYEMLTGQKAFDGESDSRVLARVIEREPDWSQLPAGLPLGILVLLQRCLEKDPRKRRRDSGDVRLDLEQALAEPHREHRPKDSSSRERIWIGVAGGLGLAVIGLLLGDAGSDRRTSAPTVVRFSVAPPSGGRLVTPLFSGNAAPVGGTISPDGRTLAFTATDASGVVKLWVRSLDAVEARALPETDDAALPFWSPDNESLGFFAQGKLKRIDVDGGPPQALADVERGQGGTWNSRGIILYSRGLSSALSQVSALGDAPVSATTLTERELAHRFPHFLPDGEHFIYYTEGVRPEDSGLYISALGGGNGGRLLITADSGAVYAPPDQLLYARQGTLLAQRFDLEKLELVGEPVRLVQSVPFEGSAPAFSASATAVLSYRSGADDSAAQQLAWVDRSGRVLETVGPPGPYRGIDVSPDGGRIATHSHVDSGGDIVVFEPRGTTTRITFDPTLDHASPIWSPNGRRIAFGSLRDGKWGIHTVDGNGAGDEQLLTEAETSDDSGCVVGGRRKNRLLGLRPRDGLRSVDCRAFRCRADTHALAAHAVLRGSFPSLARWQMGRIRVVAIRPSRSVRTAVSVRRGILASVDERR